MVGSALCRALEARGGEDVVTRTRAELDLTNQAAVQRFFAEETLDAVYLSAAKVGGILANSRYPADFIADNLAIQQNVIMGAHEADVDRLLFLGSSCIYPREAEQPIREEALLTGPLEPTNEPYAVAKIAGIKLCESLNRQFGRDYRCLMPTNLYGPHDNFHPDNSHVVPALMRRFHEAKQAGEARVTVWGSGHPMREFLHVDDLAEASLHLMHLDRKMLDAQTEPMRSHLNAGTGRDCTIRELAERISDVVGFGGEVEFDTSKPDGTPRKRLDVSRMDALGWSAKTSLEDGLRETYGWYLENVAR